jgi:hypothetical protein
MIGWDQEVRAHLAAGVERGGDLQMQYDNLIPAGERGNATR